MSDELRFRVRESPTGGSRLAFSYLAALIAAAVAGLVWAVWTPFDAAVCGDADDVVCALGWYAAGGLVGGALGIPLGAWVLHLGWEWCIAAIGLLGFTPIAGMLPGWAFGIYLVLTPALAGAATWTGEERPRRRPIAIGVAAAVLLAAGLASVFI